MVLVVRVQKGLRPGHGRPSRVWPSHSPRPRKLTRQVQSHMGQMDGSHKSEPHTHERGETERGMSSWGGWEATGYVPPNAGQAGAARHRTERWEPQAEGKQQEGTFKPLVKNQPHQTTRGTQRSEAEAPASWTERCPGLTGHE